MEAIEDVKGPYASSPADIRATAEDIATTYGFDEAILAGAICAAILAERERATKSCADIAAERVSDLYAGAKVMPQDHAFASQMVEALIIWQRITRGHQPKSVPDMDNIIGGVRKSIASSIRTPTTDKENMT